MRPLLVCVMTGLILGGVKLFIDSDTRSQPRERTHIETVASTDSYDVELRLTFDVGPDAFGLDTLSVAPSLLLQLNGQRIFTRTDTVLATESPIVIEDVQGVEVGTNEFFVQASPTGQDATPRSLRVRILQNDQTLAERSIWTELSGPVQGTVPMEVSR